MVRRARQVLSRQSSLFALGSAVSLAGLVATSVVAARLMGTDAFSAYAAMLSILGVLGTGVAGALEQETARRAATAIDRARGARPPLALAAGASTVAALIVLLPLGWQETLFDHRAAEASGLIILGVIGLHVAALAKGALAGEGYRARLGLAIGLTGVLPVASGTALALTGLDPFLAFGVGTVIGGSCAIAVAGPVRGAFLAPRSSFVTQSSAQMTALIAGNLLLTANMVAVPAVLRAHVDDLSTSVVASLQIVVSLSRLSTLFVANAVSVVVAAASREPRGHAVLGGTAAAAAFGCVATLGTALLAPILLPVVFGSAYSVGVGSAALASISVLFLNPAFVLTGVAVARGRNELIAWAWGCGAIVLAVVAGWPEPPGGAAVLTGIAISAALPAVIMVPGLARRRPFGQKTTRRAATTKEKNHRA